MKSNIQHFLKTVFPSLHFPLLRLKLEMIELLENTKQLRNISVTKSRCKQPKVFYGFDHIPSEDEYVHGGMVKFQKLQRVLPNSPKDFNILYLGSSCLPRGSSVLVDILKRKGIKIVLNQNGVAYPAWKNRGWATMNQPMYHVLKNSDHVFYQSQFCKKSADQFLGPPKANWEVLFNSVALDRFFPDNTFSQPTCWNLLLAGNQNQEYRFVHALNVLFSLIQSGINVNLVVTGQLLWNSQAPAIANHLIREKHLENHVSLRGKYKQSEAPSIFRQAHILLHTQIADSCPTIVLEALASGLPVIYFDSGGVPELVGSDSGIGIPTQATWRKAEASDPALFCSAVKRVMDDFQMFRRNARNRAEKFFDQGRWLQRHVLVFQSLLNQ